MKAIGICGIPATGKTTVMREFMIQLLSGTCNSWTIGRYGTLDFLQCENVYVLGKYDHNPFDGTDRLSMAVINDAKTFIKQLMEDDVVLFEGDRLFCDRFLSLLLSKADCLFIQLYAEEVIQQRWAERASEGAQQDAKFIKGRVTKYSNLRMKFPMIQPMKHNISSDTLNIVNMIINFIQG